MSTHRTHIPHGPSTTTPPPVARSPRSARWRPTSARGLARLAGALYLVIVVCGLFSELVVRGGVIVDGDAAATAANILASEGLFRLGLVSDLTMILADVGLTILLYVLLRPVGRTLALTAAVLRLLMDAVLGVNMLAHVTALLALTEDGLGAIPSDQRDATALLALEAHAYGYLIALVFFAMHLVVLGVLIHRSGFMPRWLGILMGLAAAGYLVDSLSFFLVPGYSGALSPLALAPVFVGELAIVGWLLVRGVDEDRWRRRVDAADPR